MTPFTIDFGPMRTDVGAVQQLADPLTPDDLRRATASSVDAMLALIIACTDADVPFVALDPEATEGLTNADGDALGWTLSHVIFHTTATAEASAFAALELARGIALQGVSRHVSPWESIETIEQCRQRLRESKRMRLASLEGWPDRPDLSNRYIPFPAAGPLNARGLFVLGLEHDDTHRRQLEKVVRQIGDATAARRTDG